MLAQAGDAPRIALVVGNEDYPAEVGRLANPHEDAQAIAQALEQVGFSLVGGGVVRDADKAGLERAVFDFQQELRRAGPEAVGFFYYSGHGGSLEISGRRSNYLIPAGSLITGAEQLPLLGVELGDVIDAMAATGARAVFVVSDACRNTLPFTSSLGGAQPDRGFVAEAGRAGMFIAHSTAEGETAPDDGVFARALARQLVRPGQIADVAFLYAFREVASSRPGYRLPTASASLSEDVCFSSCPSGPADPAALAYERAVERGSPEALRGFLSLYGDSPQASEVRDRLGAIETTAEADSLTGATAIEAAAWGAVDLANPSSLRDFLEAFPAGAAASAANSALSELDAEAWRLASAADTTEAYQAYLDSFPDGANLVEASERRSATADTSSADEAAWATASQANTAESYRNYLSIWPSGAHVEQAALALERLSLEPYELGALPAEVRDAVERARGYSASGMAMVEEFAPVERRAREAAARSDAGEAGYISTSYGGEWTYHGEQGPAGARGFGALRNASHDHFYLGDMSGDVVIGRSIGWCHPDNEGFGCTLIDGEGDARVGYEVDHSGRYTGQFLDVDRDGYGVRDLGYHPRRDCACRRYEGQFADGRWDGYGVLWDADGRGFTAGVWRSDNLVQTLAER